jgi:DNA ligase-1
MELQALVNASRKVAATRSRLEKRATLGECLRRAGPGDVAVAVAYLGGALPQGRIGLGPAMLRQLAQTEPAADAALSLAETDRAFAEIASLHGPGSQAARRERLRDLFARATAAERDFLIRLILGELRQGALEGLLVEAIAEAAKLPASDVRRAVMLAGQPGSVAEAALRDGPAGLARFRLEPLQPIQPMLASPAEDIGEAMATLKEAALEYKLDGARVQIHRVGRDVRIFSRGLNDVTASLPEVVSTVRGLPSSSVILDGEVLALDHGGRPLPFQMTMRRFGRKSRVDALRESLPLSVFLFDCLHVDGEDLIDVPARERHARLVVATGSTGLVPRLETADPAAAGDFLAEALRLGHEGVMAKALTATYAAGSRGADWLKVKQSHRLDLVVLAAEWGSGRRKGRLSNLHLGARNPSDGGYVMLGKTFKGLTDALLDWQTRRLLALELGREGNVVHVRPELVVEIAVNEIQRSAKYPGGMALRFARVKRFRPDKSAVEADTIDTVRSIFDRQAGWAPG